MSKKRRQSAAKRASKKSFGRTAPVPKPPPARKTIAPAERLDLYHKHKNEYLASAMPSFVRCGPASYLALDGNGKPGAPEFAKGIGALYSVAFGVKMASKAAGKNYVVTKVEALWWREDDADTPTKDTVWNWQLLMRVPTFITMTDITAAAEGVVARGGPVDVRQVQLIELHEETCVQILHVGPYAEENTSIAKMRAFAERAGRMFTGKHHEIYLADPSRVKDDKLRTILRQPVG